MDYIRIHADFISYCKTVPTIERLRKRNPTDPRLINGGLYIEMHHIVPRSLGGLNETWNLVELLPEEHLFVHKLRYKAFETRIDMLAVRFIVNGLANKGYIPTDTKLTLTKDILSTYAWIKTHSHKFRTEHGWHTDDGIERISVSRKGTMPVKDAITGRHFGSMSVDHPKVISGEWVHTSSGYRYSEDQRCNRRSQRGTNNTNYKEFATKKFLLEVLDTNLSNIEEDGYFKLNKFNKILKHTVEIQYERKIHARTIVTKRFGSIKNFIDSYNAQYGQQLQYDPFHRSSTQRGLLQQYTESKIWITDGEKMKLIPRDESIPTGWKRGRINVKNRKT